MPRPRLPRRLDSPGGAAAVAAALIGAILAVAIAAHGGEPGALVRAGDQLVDARLAPDELVVHRDSFGYDGQFVYRLGLDPLTDTPTDYGITLDNPVYRQQRIGLPAVVWAVDRSTPLSLAVALLLVNAAALATAAWYGARWAQAYGRHALWGVLVALTPGLVIALLRDLTEALSWAGLVAGLWHWRAGQRAVATGAFCLAVATRETSLAVLGGMGLWYLAAGPPRSVLPRFRTAAWLLVPLAVFAGIQLWLHGVWGSLPVTSNDGNLGTPVVGVLAHLFADPGTGSGALRWSWIAERIGLLAFLGIAARAAWRGTGPAELRAAWVLAALLALSTDRWTRDVQFFRASHEAVAVGVLLLLAYPTRWSRWALVGTAVVSGVVAAVHAVAI